MKSSPLFFLFLSSFMSFCQGETNNWYFGNGAGIQFNEDGTTTSLKNGRIDTFEGCATISDSESNLLFYTDGIKVFNKKHEIMENGDDLFGHPSSTQSAIIVPKPGDSNIYYVFTVDTRSTGEDIELSYDGFNYTIVDMSFNDGLGRVTQKNIKLLEASAEKISAVLKDCIDGSLWVITLSSIDGKEISFEADDGSTYNYIEDYNTFHAFEVNKNGVSNTSVRSTFQHDSTNRVFDVRGYLKLSPKGDKLASANEQSNGLFIYDFNKDTGIASNEQKIDFQIGGESILETTPYGIEFSPNGKYLYTHAQTFEYEEALDSVFISSSLLQYNTDLQQISESELVIEKDRKIFRGALQLGSNGKIYRTIAKDYDNGTNFLGVINNPNLKGVSCDYVHNAVRLDGLATQGLPPFIQSYFENEDLILLADGTKSNTLTIGLGEEFTLAAENYDDATFLWYKNGKILNNDTKSTIYFNNATTGDSGRYRLEIKFYDPKKCSIIGLAIIDVVDKFELGFPKFFTPNGDGVNEYWHHTGKNTPALKNLNIMIYDRYGKLIKQLESNHNGWDGTFNSRPMPSNDYWFKAIGNNGNIFTGHFSLKR